MPKAAPHTATPPRRCPDTSRRQTKHLRFPVRDQDTQCRGRAGAVTHTRHMVRRVSSSRVKQNFTVIPITTSKCDNTNPAATTRCSVNTATQPWNEPGDCEAEGGRLPLHSPVTACQHRPHTVKRHVKTKKHAERRNWTPTFSFPNAHSRSHIAALTTACPKQYTLEGVPL